jgi:hypothetical protein
VSPAPQLVADAGTILRNVLALRHGGSRSGRSYAVTMLTPILPGRGRDLARHLQRLETGPKSPLARLPSVHFGRWVVIDQLKTAWPGAPDPRPTLRSQYVLFTASVTAPEGGRHRFPQSFLEVLHREIAGDADAIWSHCVGYPGSRDRDAFVGYLAKSQLETALFHVGYPDVTVQEVRRALAIRDSLVTFARDHQGMRDAAQLQQAYLRGSQTWFRST